MVPEMSDFKTVLHLGNQPHETAYLKRLALFCDKIYYVPTQVYLLEREPERDSHGNFSFEVFSDCTPYYLSHLDKLEDTLPAFEDAGIATRIFPPNFVDDPTGPFDLARKQITHQFYRDPEFISISGTQTFEIPRLTVTAERLDGPRKGEEVVYHAVQLPNSAQDIITIVNTALLSESLSSFPIFAESRFRNELLYLVEQYNLRIPELARQFPNLVPGDRFEAKFGDMSFSLACELFSEQELAQVKAETIVALRNELAEPRKRHVSKDLIELAELLEAPWTDRTSDEVHKYIKGKLNQDIQTYNDKAREIKDKFVGSVTVAIAKATKYAVMSGAAAGIIGQVLPVDSLWAMVLAAGITAGPNFVKALVEKITSREQLKRSSIAYIMNLKSRL